MIHLQPRTAAVFDLHGVTFRSYASTASGARSLAAWHATFGPHTPGQAHTMTEEEVVYVISGTLDAEVDADRFAASAGDSILVPAGAVFRISNHGDAEASVWVTTRLGMQATMHPGGQQLSPPWAQ